MASPGRSSPTREGIKARVQLASQSSHESLHGLLSTAASAPADLSPGGRPRQPPGGGAAAAAGPGAGAQRHLPAGRLLLYGVLGAILLMNVAWVWQEAAAGRWGGGRVFARSAVVKPSPLAFQVRSRGVLKGAARSCTLADPREQACARYPKRCPLNR